MTLKPVVVLSTNIWTLVSEVYPFCPSVRTQGMGSINISGCSKIRTTSSPNLGIGGWQFMEPKRACKTLGFCGSTRVPWVACFWKLVDSGWTSRQYFDSQIQISQLDNELQQEQERNGPSEQAEGWTYIATPLWWQNSLPACFSTGLSLCPQARLYLDV